MNASAQITKYIASMKDWRGKEMAKLRKLILKAAPELTEEMEMGHACFFAQRLGVRYWRLQGSRRS